MAVSGKSSCLLVVSAKEGVPAQSFIHAFTLCHSAFSLQLASPDRKPIDFIEQDESSKRWLNEFKTKPFSTPVKLDTIDASRYAALLLVDSPGALHDLAHDKDLAQILHHFKTETKPVCAIGMGVAALCCDMDANTPGATWAYYGYSMTAPSVYELARSPTFSSLPIILEDFIKDHGATYSASEVDAVHIVVDRHLITGQNEASTLTAVQNLILLCNANAHEHMKSSDAKRDIRHFQKERVSAINILYTVPAFRRIDIFPSELEKCQRLSSAVIAVLCPVMVQ